MSIRTYIEVGLLIISAFVCFTLIIYLFVNGKKNSVFYTFIWCQILLIIWCGGLILEVFSGDKSTKWSIVCIEYFSISFIGISWLVFSLYYTDNKLINKISKLWILFIPAIMSYIMLLTNKFHNLFFIRFEYTYRIYGLFFWINVTQVYIYIIVANILMIRYSLKQFNYQKGQMLLIIVGSIIPIFSNGMYIFKIVKLDFDATPVSFSITMIFATIAIFKYRFLDIMPNALTKVFYDMNEAIVIVNGFNKITEVNSAFKNLFNNNINTNDDVNKIVMDLTKKAVNCDENIMEAILKGNKPVSGAVILEDKEYVYYLVNVQPIFNSQKKFLGKIITFNNISVYKRLMNNLDIKNKELSLINEKLKEHLTTAAELASEKERNRIAQEVHDTLGHTFTLLIALLEVCKITYKKDAIMTEKKLTEAADIAREGLKELRQSLAHLKSSKMKSENFFISLKNLISGFELTGIKIELITDSIVDKLSENYADAIYRICKEALTNSLRHGKAEHISIILKSDEETIRLFILDDGYGCNNINKGLGITGMEERIEKLNGSLVYGSDGEKGFNIHIEIPIGGDV